MRENWLTTLFGFLLAGASAFLTTTTAQTTRVASDIARVVQAVGAAGLGAAAADNRKVVTKRSVEEQWLKSNSPQSSAMPAKR